jgi:hypothetical protein
MLCNSRSDRRPSSWTAHARAPRSLSRDPLDERRRELAALLEEIRDPAPRPEDIIQAVQEAAGGLSGEGLTRIEARIAALYEAR